MGNPSLVKGMRRPFQPPPKTALETHYETDRRTRSSSRSSSRTRSRSRSNSRSVPMPPRMQQPPPRQRKVVCGMAWSDSNGSGAYTGEVNGLNIPDGMGSMRYNSGLVVEGMWNDGEIDDVNDEGSTMSYRPGQMERAGQGGLDGFLGRKNGMAQREKATAASVM